VAPVSNTAAMPPAPKRQQRYYQNGTPTKTTSFYANFVYENSSLPAWINYDEGRLVLNTDGSLAANEGYIKDHLGNVRVAYYWYNYALKIQQVNSYYPFGMNIKGLTADGSATYKRNEYLYNGKMIQDEHGLNWLDYGARFYDGVLGRWHSPDPLEQYESGYVYSGNNPICMNDPSGMWAEAITKTVIDPKGKIIYHDDSKNKTIYLSPDGIVGRDGNTNGLSVIGQEDPRNDYTKGRYVWFNDDKSGHITASYYYPASGRIDEDNTIEEIVFPAYAGFRYIKYAYNLYKLINSAKKYDRNGLSRVGRALQKHKDRGYLQFSNIEFSHKTGDKTGLDLLKRILNSKKSNS